MDWKNELFNENEKPLDKIVADSLVIILIFVKKNPMKISANNTNICPSVVVKISMLYLLYFLPIRT